MTEHRSSKITRPSPKAPLIASMQSDPASKTRGFKAGSGQNVTPQDILQLQRLVGNHAVQQMLHRKTIVVQHAPPSVQRLNIRDTTLNKLIQDVEGGVDALGDIEKTFTDWEKEAKTSTAKAKRRAEAINAINEYTAKNIKTIPGNIPNLADELYYLVLANLRAREQAIDGGDLLETCITLSLPDGEFDTGNFRKLERKGFLQELSLEQQEIFLQHIIVTNFEDWKLYFGDFDKVVDSPDVRVQLMMYYVKKMPFLAINNDQREEIQFCLLGNDWAEDEIINLKLVQTPSLFVVLQPTGFADVKKGQEDKQRPKGELNAEQIKFVYDSAEWQPVLAAIEEQGYLDLMHTAIQQLAYFVFNVNPNPEVILKVRKTLISIINTRMPGAKAHLYDALINIMALSTASQENFQAVDQANDNTRMLTLILLDVCPTCMSLKPVESFLKGEGSANFFKLADPSKRIINSLICLKTVVTDKSRCSKIVTKIFVDTTGWTRYKIVGTFSFLEMYIKGHRMEFDLNETTFDFKLIGTLVTQEFAESLEIEPETIEAADYERLKAVIRNLNALLGYVAEMRSKYVDEPLKLQKAITLLRAFVLAAMKDDKGRLYHDLRYGKQVKETSIEWKHLDMILGLGETGEKLVKAWSKNEAAEAQTSDMREYIILDTDAPGDMLMIGQDFRTCQSAVGGSLNECLLSYMIDGKNRVIAIKKKNDKEPLEQQPMIARCVFKLLWNTVKQVPVLFLEQLYYNGQSIDDQQALSFIIEMAKAKARLISSFCKVDLAISRMSFYDPTLYPNELTSMGSPWEHEYNDTGGGASEGGFTVGAEMAIQLPYEKK